MAVATVPASIGSTDSHCCHRAPLACGMAGGGSSESSPAGSGGAGRRGGRLMTSVLTSPDARGRRPGPLTPSRRPAEPFPPARCGPNAAAMRQTRGVEHPPGLDLDQLAAYLAGTMPDVVSPLQGELIAGGK